MTFINPGLNNNDLAILTGQSLASSFVSLPIIVTANNAFSFQIVYSGSPNGTFTVQTSNDGSVTIGAAV